MARNERKKDEQHGKSQLQTPKQLERPLSSSRLIYITETDKVTMVLHLFQSERL